MRIVFASIFLNHHLKPLCDELASIPGVDFKFIATDSMPQQRIDLGWSLDQVPSYVTQDVEVLDSADVAIFGLVAEELVQRGINRGIPVFRYTERPLKNGAEPLKAIPRYMRWHHRNPAGKPIYLLCASAFASSDYAKYGLFRNRAYRFGYFTPFRYQEDLGGVLSSKDSSRILWCGRFIGWKHPDDAIRVASRLKSEDLDFALDFIGLGPKDSVMREMIASEGLSGSVRILDPLTPDAVRDQMEATGIYLFTSDFKEGWGAVLNEAMNSGCAVVASHAIGSVPYLFESGHNGLVYHSGNVNELYKAVRTLLDDAALQRKLGASAYETIANEWNAKVAAVRFVALAQAILEGAPSPDLYVSGPCSKADRITNDWFDSQAGVGVGRLS